MCTCDLSMIAAVCVLPSCPHPPVPCLQPVCHLAHLDLKVMVCVWGGGRLEEGGGVHTCGVCCVKRHARPDTTPPTGLLTPWIAACDADAVTLTPRPTCNACTELHLLGCGQLLLQPALLVGCLCLLLRLVRHLAIVQDAAGRKGEECCFSCHGCAALSTHIVLW